MGVVTEAAATISTTIPYGAMAFAVSVLLALWPVRRPWPLAVFSFVVGSVPNELPFVYLYLVVATSIPIVVGGDATTAGGAASIVIAALTVIGLAAIVHRGLLARDRVEQAMGDGLGADWRTEIDATLERGRRRRRPWLRIVVAPWTIWRRDVERTSNIAYGDRGRSNLLDIYRHRSHPDASPIFIYLHGGRFRWGRKSRESRPLLYHLASRGWLCVSANYELTRTPAEGFPQHLVDVKRVIAWLRDDGPAYGADATTIVISGGSAGAHLALMAALTPNDVAFQPGFETSDTSVTAAIGLYGYYGPVTDDERRPPSTPFAHVRRDAPPVLIVHGDNDTYTSADQARHLAAELRTTSTQPVVYAELPGAQHAFDLFHSIRFEAVVDGIDAFTAWVRSADLSTSPRPAQPSRSSS